MPNKKPDPNVFARTVLFEMAQTHAIVSHLSQITLQEIAIRRNLNEAENVEFHKQFWLDVNKKTKKIYEVYADEVGVLNLNKESGAPDAPNTPSRE